MSRGRLKSILVAIKVIKNNPDMDEENLYDLLRDVYKTAYSVGRKSKEASHSDLNK